MTINFKLDLIKAPRGYLTADAAKQFNLFAISCHIKYGMTLKVRNELRLESISYAKKNILENDNCRPILNFYLFFYEKFEGIGWASRFQRRLIEIRDLRGIDKIIYYSKSEGMGRVSWVDDINEYSLEIANTKYCFGIVCGDLHKISDDRGVIDSIAENGGVGMIRAELLSNNVFNRIYSMHSIDGFFCFSGYFDDPWSDLLIFMKR